ncbi:MAG: AAA family ATPase [Bacteroidales bacterium]|nr:AAA family ATPase [Bacteroidales bacterium]
MIQELKFKNFMSFKDEVTLSFEATKDITFEDYHVVEVAPGVRLLRFAMVYGANASGKSNLLEAIDFLQDFFFAKASDIAEPTGAVPFKLDAVTPNEPSEFSLKFYVGETKYWYELKLTSKQVLSEKLYFYDSVQPKKLFDRKLENGQSVISYNPATVKISAAAKEEISLKCLPNMSFFAAKNQVNLAIEKIDLAKEWLRNNLMPMIHPTSGMFDYASKKMYNNEALKSYLLDFVHQADFNISDVKSDKVSEKIPQQFVNMILADDSTPEEIKEKVRSEQSITRIETMFEHTVRNERGVEKYLMSTESQSEGTKRTIGIEAAVYEAMDSESFLYIDEIEASLHPELVEFILQKFLSKKSRAQMLVTTHYDMLLNSVGDDLIRKDSVWFTEKKENGSTDLYSLVEYKGLNRISSFQKAYRNGVFGALPNIKG